MSRLPRTARWALALVGLVFLPACMMTEMPPWDWPGAVLQSIHDLAPQGSGTSTQPVKSTVVPSPSTAGATYVLVFDSTITTLVTPGTERVRATVPLMPQAEPNSLAGEAPLEIVSADGDGVNCTNIAFTEQPGTFRVVSVKLALQADGGLTGVDLVYSLDPQVKCADGGFSPSNWNLFWMVYDGHFTHTDDKLDDSGPEPLITVGHWHFNGRSANRGYDWSSPAAVEHTTIKLDPVTP